MINGGGSAAILITICPHRCVAGWIGVAAPLAKRRRRGGAHFSICRQSPFRRARQAFAGPTAEGRSLIKRHMNSRLIIPCGHAKRRRPCPSRLPLPASGIDQAAVLPLSQSDGTGGVDKLPKAANCDFGEVNIKTLDRAHVAVGRTGRNRAQHSDEGQ